MARKQDLSLTPQERALKSRKSSEAVQAVLVDRKVSAIVESFAKCKSPDAPRIEMEDGTIVVPTIKEEIVYNALMKERDEGRGFQTILDMQKVLGEAKDEIKVSVSLVDQDLMRRSLD